MTNEKELLRITDEETGYYEVPNDDDVFYLRFINETSSGPYVSRLMWSENGIENEE